MFLIIVFFTEHHSRFKQKIPFIRRDYTKQRNPNNYVTNYSTNFQATASKANFSPGEQTKDFESNGSSFKTQNIVVVDHNCGEGKQADDNGECRPSA